MTDPYNILFTRAGNNQVQQAVQPEQAVKSLNRTTGRFTGSGQAVGSIQSQEGLEELEMKRAIKASQEALEMKQVQQAVQPEQAVKSLNRTTGRFTRSGQTVGSKALEMKRTIKASQEELPMESDEMVVPEYLVSLSQNARLRLNTEQKSQGVETAVRFKEKSVNLAKFYYSSSPPNFDYINCDNDNMSLLFRMHLLNTPSDDELPYIINGFNILHDMTSNEDETREFRKWVAMYKEMQNYRVAMRIALQMS